jgi:hypothetical protein
MELQPDEARYFRQLEEHLLEMDVRKSPQDVANLLADEFVEFGRSGLIYDRHSIIAALQREEPARLTMSDFSARQLADTVVLVTYRSTRHGSAGAKAVHSLRSSIWKLIGERWQMIFHQGTGSDPAGLSP